jgi:thymidylate synthase
MTRHWPSNFNLKCNSLGEAWLRSLQTIIDHGDWVTDNEERLYEVCNLSLEIASIDEKDPVIIQYADGQRIAFMKHKYVYCQILPQYKISYGALLYENNGVDQIKWVIARLQAKRETKSATIGLHVPGANDLSCLSMLDFKIRNNELQMTSIYRSQNVFASQPGNIVAMHDIHKRVAKETGSKLGPFFLTALSAHIYEKDLVSAKKVVKETRAR